MALVSVSMCVIVFMRSDYTYIFRVNFFLLAFFFLYILVIVKNFMLFFYIFIRIIIIRKRKSEKEREVDRNYNKKHQLKNIEKNNHLSIIDVVRTHSRK